MTFLKCPAEVEFRSGDLCSSCESSVDALIGTLLLHQLGMLSALADLSALQHQYAVHVLQRRDPLGDHHGGHLGVTLFQCRPEGGLGVGIQRGGGVIDVPASTFRAFRVAAAVKPSSRALGGDGGCGAGSTSEAALQAPILHQSAP